MQKEIKKHVKCRRAFTLIEVILASVMAAIVVTALIGVVYSNYKNWKLGSRRSALLQDGRAVLEQMTRILRQSKGFIAVSSPADQAGQITFTDVAGTVQQFRRNASTNEIEYGQPASLSALTGSVSSLVFTCYDADANSLAAPVQVGKIRSVGIAATLVNPDGSLSFALYDRVFVQEDLPSGIIINEIMYNPSGSSSDAPGEWVELYNISDSAIDVNGWTIWTGVQSNSDLLISHPQFGDGTTEIPANGYAVITSAIRNFYTELVTNGGFESINISKWIINPGSGWTLASGDTHRGIRKLQSTAIGATSVYQQITVPSSGFNSCLFLFWEKTTAPVGQTQITATIRNTSDVILAAGYNGQMSSNWTCHTMDITAFAGQTIRIYFAANKATSSGTLRLDDVSAAASYVNINAVRLGVGDDKIGNGLANNGDTAAIVAGGGTTVDSVTYSSSWGGNGNGTSLSRISPEGPSNDANNWTSGPVNGTPGAAN
jgi:Tfp pilus assembly protein PilV